MARKDTYVLPFRITLWPIVTPKIYFAPICDKWGTAAADPGECFREFVFYQNFKYFILSSSFSNFVPALCMKPVSYIQKKKLISHSFLIYTNQLLNKEYIALMLKKNLKTAL